MDKLASSEFRRYFAKLDAPTEVTVNGHKIGTWLPVASEEAATVLRRLEEIFGQPSTPLGRAFAKGEAQANLSPNEKLVLRDVIRSRVKADA